MFSNYAQSYHIESRLYRGTVIQKQRWAKNRKGEMPPPVPEFTEKLRPRIQLTFTTGHLLFIRETTSLHGQKHSHLASQL